MGEWLGIESEVLAWAVGLGIPALYLLGALAAFDAIMKARTPQGSTAWAISLVSMPWLALPLYLVFGRDRFTHYVESLRSFNREIEARLAESRRGPLTPYLVAPDDERGEMEAFRALATAPFTSGNDARLLVDGHATFDAIFAGIDAAERYVLAQFYIIHDDEIGTRFKERLLAAAARGVAVYLLYDEVGSLKLPNAYLRALRDGGVHVSSFAGRRGWLGRFRLNFRNHRKVVVVDGRRAYVGGLNVGDEYLGRHETLAPWRDTHLEVAGPVVQGVQLSFVRDWFYGTAEVPEPLVWEPAPAEADRCALVLASGPDAELETCGLLFAHAIGSAERRVWIASPYFVPDGRVLGALQIAALRGVDVRVLMPRMTDSPLFKYVPYAYLPDAELAGVKTYLYEEGFMHQKAILVDDDYAAVSTANFDNRSFRLNFEITVLLADEGFAHDLEAMFEADFARSTRLTSEDMANPSLRFRVATQFTRLLAPIL